MRNNLLIITLFLGVFSYAQNDVFVNLGDMVVEPNTIVSTHFKFDNNASGNVLNNGQFYFYRDYNNDGLFSYDGSKVGLVRPLAVFEGATENNLSVDIQDITGGAQSKFYDVLFNKRGTGHSFLMSNSVVVAGNTEMREGVVLMDHQNGGVLTYLKGATHSLTSDFSHVDGEVVKEGDEEFKYPIGNRGYYRFAAISAPADSNYHYLGQYFFKNSDGMYPHNKKEGDIGFINNREYWTVKQGANVEGGVLVTLSWDERTTPYDIYRDGARYMRIVRWDENKEKWVDEGGIVDVAAKTITTVVNPKDYGVFTMAGIEKADTPEIEIFNGVSDNGDNSNDNMVIKGAEKVENKLMIFNRWGVMVYESDNYGHYDNFFKGVSEGRITIQKEKKLPQGVYYYIFEYINSRGERVNKASWIYLRNQD